MKADSTLPAEPTSLDLRSATPIRLFHLLIIQIHKVTHSWSQAAVTSNQQTIRYVDGIDKAYDEKGADKIAKKRGETIQTTKSKSMSMGCEELN